MSVPKVQAKPKVVCLCGSARFMDAFFEQGWIETLLVKLLAKTCVSALTSFI